MNTKIFVVTHKEFELPSEKGNCYYPIVAGKANNHESFPEYYLLDNMDDNISSKHDKYSEYTVVYWIRHNVRDADVIGINHYRRYFVRMNYFQYLFSFIFNMKNYKMRKVLSEKDIEEIFSDGTECILPKRESKYPDNMKGLFTKYHSSKIIDDARNVIMYTCPDYIETFDKVFQSNSYYLKCICIMKKELFFEYADWMFSILSKLENCEWCTGNRELAFLGEHLLNIFINKNVVDAGRKYKEMYFVNTDRSIKDFGKIDLEFWAPGWLKKFVSKIRNRDN